MAILITITSELDCHNWKVTYFLDDQQILQQDIESDVTYIILVFMHVESSKLILRNDTYTYGKINEKISLIESNRIEIKMYKSLQIAIKLRDFVHQ